MIYILVIITGWNRCVIHHNLLSECLWNVSRSVFGCNDIIKEIEEMCRCFFD